MRRIIVLAIVVSPSLSLAQAPKRVTLPPHDARFEQPFGGNNERIIGAGAKSLYVLESDSDDLQYIRRHPWPSIRLPG
jgi:hypothetical protein